MRRRRSEFYQRINDNRADERRRRASSLPDFPHISTYENSPTSRSDPRRRLCHITRERRSQTG